MVAVNSAEGDNMATMLNFGHALAAVGTVVAISTAQPAFAQTGQTGSQTVSEAAHTANETCPFDGKLDPNQIPETRNGTEMVGIKSCWIADEDNDKFNDLNDFYAHWSVRELPLRAALPRAYDLESKSAVLRLFVGRDLSVVGSLRIDLHDPDTTFVVPLASFSYEGRVGKGQNWSTNLVSDDQSLGFFRISPTTSAQIAVTAKSTSTLQVQAASTVLGVLRDLSTIASPGGALVTTLNRDAIRQTSTTLDNALSSIWGQSREESHTSARQLAEWYPGARFIVQLTMPRHIKARTSASVPPEILTRWYEVSLSCPRRSIFSSVVECKARTPADAATVLNALAGRVSAPQVLNVKVTGGTTLQQFVSGHDWYSRFLRIGDTEPGNGEQATKSATVPTSESTTTVEALTAATVVANQPPTNGAEAAPAAPPTPPTTASGTATKTVRTESDYSALCSSIVNSLYSIGFSRLDSQIGLWAIVTGSSDFVGIQDKFQSNPRCTSLLPLANRGATNPWAFATLQQTKEKPKPASKTIKRRRKPG